MNNPTSPSTIKPVRWGILGAARIAEAKTLPAMLASPVCQVHAIASRDIGKAQGMAQRFGVPKAYGSYDELLDDPQVDAVYVALPNHLHVQWARAAALKGKHVLCEKPMAMNLAEAQTLQDLSAPVLISEAFMVRHQPRWGRLRELLRSGEYGQPKTVHSLLSFFMTNPGDYRHNPAHGGGALYDLGCYTIMAARFVFEREPLRVIALADRHPDQGVDVFTSAVLDFGQGCHAVFTVSTGMASAQTLNVVCEKGYVELPKAYVPPHSDPALLQVDVSVRHDASDLVSLAYDPLDQYEAEVTHFAEAIRGQSTVFYGLEDVVANARVLDAVFRSLRIGAWVDV